MTQALGAQVVVVGAGVSGLSCAQALTAGGRNVVVLDRARGVGGRCATRRLDGQPLDFGPAFLHGRSPEFLAALAEVPATVLAGWPDAVAGAGQPCQPEAFSPGERRLAFAEGLVAFPRSLARGLDVRLEHPITRLAHDGATLRLGTPSGTDLHAPIVVLALAAEQSFELMSTIPSPSPEVLGACALLGFSQTHACLTLMALYPDDAPRPAWQIWYPESSRILQLISHDASKRPPPARMALVVQARPAWSRAHLEDAEWPDALLAETARIVGRWAARPTAQSAHRWTWARNDRSAELKAPLMLALPGGSRLGICGDRFAPGGGVEAAWCSGQAMAKRILAETKEQP